MGKIPVVIILTIFFISCAKDKRYKIEFRRCNHDCLEYKNENPNYIGSDTARTSLENAWVDSISGIVNEVFLVNNSRDTRFSFTIKTSDNNSTSNTITEIYKLNPGEQKRIGLDKYITETNKIFTRNYEVVGEIKMK